MGLSKIWNFGGKKKPTDPLNGGGGKGLGKNTIRLTVQGKPAIGWGLYRKKKNLLKQLIILLGAEIYGF